MIDLYIQYSSSELMIVCPFRKKYFYMKSMYTWKTVWAPVSIQVEYNKKTRGKFKGYFLSTRTGANETTI
jgi:hypothetical protein